MIQIFSAAHPLLPGISEFSAQKSVLLWIAMILSGSQISRRRLEIEDHHCCSQEWEWDLYIYIWVLGRNIGNIAYFILPNLLLPKNFYLTDLNVPFILKSFIMIIISFMVKFYCIFFILKFNKISFEPLLV